MVVCHPGVYATELYERALCHKALKKNKKQTQPLSQPGDNILSIAPPPTPGMV